MGKLLGRQNSGINIPNILHFVSPGSLIYNLVRFQDLPLRETKTNWFCVSTSRAFGWFLRVEVYKVLRTAQTCLSKGEISAPLDLGDGARTWKCNFELFRLALRERGCNICRKESFLLAPRLYINTETSNLGDLHCHRMFCRH